MTYVSDIDGTLLRKGIVPIHAAVAALKSMAVRGENIVLITGRPESERNSTQIALRNAGVPYNQLLMNTYGTDTRGQLLSKENNIRRTMVRGRILLAVDNDPKVRKMYESLGLIVKGAW